MTSPGYPSLHDPNDQRQPPLMPGEELAGKYRMEEVVGAGAMGVVVRAWHVELEQSVAVKFLYPEYARNADGAERFRREARAAAKIKNQHVTRVLDVGTLEGKNIPYIVMEYLEGHDLSRALREHGPLQVAVAVRYVMQACDAVAEAHERGIVHRDLKPANLFVAEGPHGERMIKVLDFGISKVNGTGGAQQFSLTDTATLMGSPAYMSPEQLESSRNVDGRADIWSLGVILHELIMGQVPFTGESVPQLVRSILAGTRSSLVERSPALAGLEAVVARCLCQEREQRFDTVLDLQEALRPFASLLLPGDPTPSLMTSRHLPIPLVHGLAGDHSFPGSLLPGSSLPGGSLPGSSLPGSSFSGGPFSGGQGLPGSHGLAAGNAGPASLGAHAPSGLPARNESSAAGTAVPAQQAPQAAGGSNGVPSAWGNTQRGRHRSWQRHGLPLALLLALVALGAYWVSEQIATPVASIPTEGHLANTPASARPTPAARPVAADVLPSLSAEVPAPAAPADAPPATPASEQPSARPAGAAAAAPQGAAPAVTSEPVPVRPAAQAAEAPPPASGPKVSPVLPEPAAPRATAKPATLPRAASVAPAEPPAPRADPRTTDGDLSDKPQTDTSSRSIPEVPDFGGRE